MIIYKYVCSERIDVLINCKIRFTQAGALNDPFDTLPDFTDYKNYVNAEYKSQPDMRIKNEEVFKDYKKCQALSGKYYVFLSLTEKKNNLLMWSHYADSHRGFVIGFDRNSSFFSGGNGKGKDGLSKIHYTDVRYRYPVNFKQLDQQEQENAMTGLLFTKSLEWEYEKEYRIIAHPNAASSTETLTNKEQCYLFDFPPETIQEIILSFAMSEPKRKEIANIVQDNFPWAKLFQSELYETRFALKISLIR